MKREFNTGKRRRAIEDQILMLFRKVDFKQDAHAYLEDEDFWDFIYSWYELVKYYERSMDTAIGAHMLDLFAQCGQKFRQAAADKTLKERRRDKASDAIYQMAYYVDRMIKQAERNGIELESQSATGTIWWQDETDDFDPSRN